MGIDIADFLKFKIRCELAARELAPNARKEIRNQAKTAALRAEASAATVRIAAAAPAAGSRRRRPRPPHVPLRALLAADITVRNVPLGAEIVQGHRGISGRNADALPRGINAGVWRHPVYGRGSVTQLGDRSYFNRPIADREALMARAIADTCAGKIDDTLNRGLG